LFTYFPKKDDPDNIIENLCTNEKYNVQYCICNPEICPETGKEHYQGYIIFASAKTFSATKKIFEKENMMGIHVEQRKGTHLEAVEYCSKMASKNDTKMLYKYGNEPHQGERSDLQVMKQRIKDGANIRAIIEESQNYQALRGAEILIRYFEKPRDWQTEVYWYWGSTGSGKSRAAFAEAGEDRWVSMKSAQWFEGYDGHANVIFDDFRGDFCKYHELLRLTDRYECRIECKGGSRQFLAKKIWITSCHPPEKAYKSLGENIDQLLRRITLIKKFGEEVEKIQEISDEIYSD